MRQIKIDEFVVIEYEGKKATHFLLSLEFAGDLDTVRKLRENNNLIISQSSSYALPAPVEEGIEKSSPCPTVIVPDLPEAEQARAPKQEEAKAQTPMMQEEKLELGEAEKPIHPPRSDFSRSTPQEGNKKNRPNNLPKVLTTL